ncbi:hypothetical protein [Methylobacterium aerolatum]|uniref:Uncharacterized protein n=1 Tax=Methylobacterium aerolatum TaxID=418708 RepID=A0ABU0HV06_9HYPH|nr:hypothetical protein [Methylobacterium aerolatum]MDQ0446162.1 hypothetical protein [Methylobacterium aerolatum]GJD35504.1 hypothetical protein FMGBMHLM_2414 [Methylobacterium aerolatum]
MLALIATQTPTPAEEAADRDPGFLTLAISLIRAARHHLNYAFACHCDLMAKAGGPEPL